MVHHRTYATLLRASLFLVASLTFASLTRGADTPQSPASAPSSAKLVAPPAYTITRYDEDYSYLRDPSRRTDLYDPIKYIPLSPSDPSVYLSLGGQLRERYEYFNHPYFGAQPQDRNGYFLTRFLFNGDLHLGPYLRFFAQGKVALEDGRTPGPRSFDRDEIEPHQLFVDLRLPWNDQLTTTVRFGRQELLYGSQRLVGVSDWTNVQRTFEGIKVINEYKSDNFINTLDSFLVRPVLIRDNPIANEVEGYNDGDDSQTFWGFYDTLLLPHLIEKARTRVETYFLVLNRQATSSISPPRLVDSDIYTLGYRLYSNPKPFDFEFENAYQVGTRGDADIFAFFVSTEAGLTIEGCPATPRPYIGFDYASGDGNRADATYSTFTQLFATGHRFFGEIDLVGRMNVISPYIGTDATLLKDNAGNRKLWARVQYLAFWRANDSDSLYDAMGNAVARPSGSMKNCIGQEVDFALHWQVDRHFLITASYNHLFAGQYIHESSGGNTSIDQDIDFAYLQCTYTF